MHPIKIAVVDDTKSQRDLIKQYLSDDDKYVIIGEFKVPSELKKFIKESSRNHPDVVLLDIGFNHASAMNDEELHPQEGLEFLPYLVDNYPKMKVIIFSYHNRVRHYVKDAFIKGARGYLSKYDGFQFDLKKAIEAITRKENPLWFYKSPDIPEEWVSEAQYELRNRKIPLEKILTDTQLRVFLGIAKGYSKSKIIALKACSRNAFDAHTSNIRQKLDLDHNWQIPYYAIVNKVKGVLEHYEKNEEIRII